MSEYKNRLWRAKTPKWGSVVHMEGRCGAASEEGREAMGSWTSNYCVFGGCHFFKCVQKRFPGFANGQAIFSVNVV